MFSKFTAIAGIGLNILFPTSVSAELIEAHGENLDSRTTVDPTDNCASIELSQEQVRQGKYSYKHFAKNCSKRAELGFEPTKIGSTYWIGWSIFIPSDFDPKDHFTIITQQAAWPSPRAYTLACGGNGHKIAINSNGTIDFSLQYLKQTGETGVKTKNENACRTFRIGHVDQWKGKWVDLVQNSKWSEKGDGFLKQWVRIGSNNTADYKVVIDYRGPTWWDEETENLGPFHKMGLYYGSEDWKGQTPQYIWTDEYKLGDKNSSLDEVSPLTIISR